MIVHMMHKRKFLLLILIIACRLDLPASNGSAEFNTNSNISALLASLPVYREGDNFYGNRPEDLIMGKFSDPQSENETGRICNVLIEFFTSLAGSSLHESDDEDVSDESSWKKYVDPSMHQLFPQLHENLFSDPIHIESLRIGAHQTAEKQMDRVSVPVRIITEENENHLYTIFLIWDKGASGKNWLIHDLIKEN